MCPSVMNSIFPAAVQNDYTHTLTHRQAFVTLCPSNDTFWPSFFVLFDLHPSQALHMMYPVITTSVMSKL